MLAGLVFALPKFNFRRKEKPPTKAEIKAQAKAVKARIRES